MSKKTHEKEIVIKFLDLIVRDIVNVGNFNIKEDILKYTNDDHEQAYLPNEIESLGKTYKLFENSDKLDGWLKLTPKGIELKEYGKGFNKFERKLERKLSYFEKWSILLIVLGLAFGVYQYQKNQSLESRVSTLENQHIQTSRDIDSLKTELLVIKNRLDKSLHQDDSLSVLTDKH